MEIIYKTNQNYPALLKEIPNAPEKFYIKGILPPDLSAEALAKTGAKANNISKIAIVGTRKATEEGRRLAKKIAYDLTQRGIIIVSGLAMGIDTAAHEGAIAAGGKTIAVLANGLNSIYPKQNENLAKKILELNGAIISEYESNMPPLEHQFLERNRIVSGLCIATIVIEAPNKSGSLVTARLAGEQGREVFVAPGPVGHQNYRGSHRLIRDGARLITSAEDIIEDLGDLYHCEERGKEATCHSRPVREQSPYGAGSNGNPASSSWIPAFAGMTVKMNENQKAIFEAIQTARKTLTIDEIIEITKLDAKVANQVLALLIVEGIIKETENGFINC